MRIVIQPGISIRLQTTIPHIDDTVTVDMTRIVKHNFGTDTGKLRDVVYFLQRGVPVFVTAKMQLFIRRERRNPNIINIFAYDPNDEYFDAIEDVPPEFPFQTLRNVGDAITLYSGVSRWTPLGPISSSRVYAVVPERCSGSETADAQHNESENAQSQ